VRDAAAQALPSTLTHRDLTGYEITQLPADEAAAFRARCVFIGTRHGVHGVYRVTDGEPAKPVQIILDRTDLA
jgi:hypothetical protein